MPPPRPGRLWTAVLDAARRSSAPSTTELRCSMIAGEDKLLARDRQDRTPATTQGQAVDVGGQQREHQDDDGTNLAAATRRTWLLFTPASGFHQGRRRRRTRSSTRRRTTRSKAGPSATAPACYGDLVNKGKLEQVPWAAAPHTLRLVQQGALLEAGADGSGQPAADAGRVRGLRQGVARRRPQPVAIGDKGTTGPGGDFAHDDGAAREKYRQLKELRPALSG